MRSLRTKQVIASLNPDLECSHRAHRSPRKLRAFIAIATRSTWNGERTDDGKQRVDHRHSDRRAAPLIWNDCTCDLISRRRLCANLNLRGSLGRRRRIQCVVRVTRRLNEQQNRKDDVHVVPAIQALRTGHPPLESRQMLGADVILSAVMVFIHPRRIYV